MRMLLVLFTILMSFAALGQSVPSEINAGQLLLDLLGNWKTLSPLGIGMTAVLLTVWLLKTELVGGLFKSLKPGIKRIVVVVLGQVYALLYMVQSGMSWGEAVIAGVFMSGGAMAVYEAIKPLLPKKS